jgi:hypothetical protein
VQKLERDPASFYDVKIGEINYVELEKYIGDDIEKFIAFYTIVNTKIGIVKEINQTLSGIFRVEYKFNYNNQFITLKVDLTKLS